MHIILFMVFGLVVGALARLIVPGREPGGWVISMILGIAGSFLGAFIGRAIGMYDSTQRTGSFFTSLLGAIILVAIYHGFASRKRTMP
jgi:uncharacterized membrane protein YeaQ/YmgE (transglycosylase-associated protein family)